MTENFESNVEKCIEICNEINNILGFSPAAPKICTSEQSQKIYDEINMNLVKENIALKDMLSARESEIRNLKVLLDRAKKELANERARSLKRGEKLLKKDQ